MKFFGKKYFNAHSELLNASNIFGAHPFHVFLLNLGGVMKCSIFQRLGIWDGMTYAWEVGLYDIDRKECHLKIVKYKPFSFLGWSLKSHIMLQVLFQHQLKMSGFFMVDLMSLAPVLLLETIKEIYIYLILTKTGNHLNKYSVLWQKAI